MITMELYSGLNPRLFFIRRTKGGQQIEHYNIAGWLQWAYHSCYTKIIEESKNAVNPGKESGKEYMFKC